MGGVGSTIAVSFVSQNIDGGLVKKECQKCLTQKESWEGIDPAIRKSPHQTSLPADVGKQQLPRGLVRPGASNCHAPWDLDRPGQPKEESYCPLQMEESNTST